MEYPTEDGKKIEIKENGKDGYDIFIDDVYEGSSTGFKEGVEVASESIGYEL